MTIILIFLIVIASSVLYFKTREFTWVILYIFATFAVSGLTQTIVEIFIGLVSVTFSLLTTTVVSVLIATFLIARSTRGEKIRFQLLIEFSVIGFSLVTMGILINARIQAAPVLKSVLAGAGRVASAEDNAKWLNFASHVATGEMLNFKDGTTGGMAVLLMVSVALSDMFAHLLFGGPNVTGAAIQGVLSAHAFLTAVAPLALIPLVGPVLSLINRESAKKNELPRKVIVAITLVSFLAASYWLTNALGAVSAFGHLSLEYIIVSLVFWLSAMVFVDPSKKFQFVLITLVGSGVGLVWLPLPGLSIAIAIVGSVVYVRYLIRQHKNLFRELTLYLLLINVVLTIWATVPELNYLGAKTVPGVSTDLVVAEGGAMVLGRFEGVLLVLTIAGFAFIALMSRRKKAEVRPTIYPVILILGFACAVTLYDFIVARGGFPHYGTRKLDYAFTVVLVGVLMPVAVSGIFIWTKAKSWMAAILCLLFLFFIQGSRTIRQATPVFTVNMWTWFDWNAIDNPNSTTKWFDIVNPSNSIQTTVENVPIACVQIENGIIKTGITAQYFCTRFLISLHGDESDHTDVIVPLIQPATEKDIEKLKSFSSDYSEAPVLVIDQDGQIIEEITWSAYIQLVEHSRLAQ